MVNALPEIHEEDCTGCGDCVDTCHIGAVGLIEGKAAIVSPDDCDYCTECEIVCPEGAIDCPFEVVLGDGLPKEDSFGR